MHLRRVARARRRLQLLTELTAEQHQRLLRLELRTPQAPPLPRPQHQAPRPLPQQESPLPPPQELRPALARVEQPHPLLTAGRPPTPPETEQPPPSPVEQIAAVLAQSPSQTLRPSSPS